MKRALLAGLLLFSLGGFAWAENQESEVERRLKAIESRVEDLFQLVLKLAPQGDDAELKKKLAALDKRVARIEEGSEASEENATLKEKIAMLIKEVDAWRNRNDARETQLQQRMNENRNLEKKWDVMKGNFDSLVEKYKVLAQDLTEILRQKDKALEHLKKALAEKDEAVHRMDKSIDDRQRLQEQLEDLKANFASLQKRYEELLRDGKEKPPGSPMPDGRIIRADIDQGYAYIDLGTKDGVRPGIRFKVFSILTGGARKEKGEIRVIRVEKDFSQCSILGMAHDNDPIEMGDFVWNKFIRRGRKLKFAFLGRFGPEYKLPSLDALKELVLAAGHVALENDRTDADFIVLGAHAKKDARYPALEKSGAEKVRPRDLVESLGE